MLADHGVLASVGSVGDAYDNAVAESFVDPFTTQLMAARARNSSWRSSSTSAGSTRAGRTRPSARIIPPGEFEHLHAVRYFPSPPSHEGGKATNPVSANPSGSLPLICHVGTACRDSEPKVGRGPLLHTPI